MLLVLEGVDGTDYQSWDLLPVLIRCSAEPDWELRTRLVILPGAVDIVGYKQLPEIAIEWPASEPDRENITEEMRTN